MDFEEIIRNRNKKIVEAKATRLRVLLDLVNEYRKTRDFDTRKAMFALAKELGDEP